MQGEVTTHGIRFECIIDDVPMIVYLFAGQYIGWPLDGGLVRSNLTEAQVVEGVEAKMDADVEAYNVVAKTRPATISRGSYYGD